MRPSEKHEFAMTYELYYWGGIQGRGEFIRLAFEEAQIDYVDIVRTPEKGTNALLTMLDHHMPYAPFAPPFLKDGDLIVSHVANILLYLGPRLNLAPYDEKSRSVAHGLQLTITDLIAEIHDTHHPIDNALYYEDQKAEAKARAAQFRKNRIPKFLSYFERTLARNPAGPDYSIGSHLTYVDLSLFQVMEGLRYTFPNAMRDSAQLYPHLSGLADAIKQRPHIAQYLRSERRLPFKADGIFRHYPELDA